MPGWMPLQGQVCTKPGVLGGSAATACDSECCWQLKGMLLDHLKHYASCHKWGGQERSLVPLSFCGSHVTSSLYPVCFQFAVFRVKPSIWVYFLCPFHYLVSDTGLVCQMCSFAAFFLHLSWVTQQLLKPFSWSLGLTYDSSLQKCALESGMDMKRLGLM